MTNNPAIVRSLLVWVICLPVAIILGFLLSNPLDKQNVMMFGVGAMLLMLPLLLRWYHTWLIVIWNMSITFIYMPGLLPGWMPVACIGFAVAVGHYILNRERKFLTANSVSWSLVFLSLAVMLTAKMRGGLGFSAFGDESIGGKRYLYIWMAVLGYFALISQPIPPRKRRLYTTLFLMGSATAALSDASVMGGPLGNILFVFFPGAGQATNTPVGQEYIERFGGIAGGCVAVIFTLMALYGIDGILNARKIWRLILFLSALVLSGFGGYRGTIIYLAITIVLVFYFEGLFRSRLMPVAVLAVIGMAGIIICFSEHMPLPFQRCLAFLPVKISAVARMNAEASSDWRLDMWKGLLPQIPHYFFLGKGLTFEANDMAMYWALGDAQAMGQAGGGLALAGDYHNGPLSVIIPFGIWGVIGFLWFLVAATRVLWANYKYGDPDLHKINTLLMCYFIAKTFMFMVVFGGLYGDMVTFVGIVGFSISLNNGVAKPAPVEERPRVAFNRFRPLPATGTAAST